MDRKDFPQLKYFYPYLGAASVLILTLLFGIVLTWWTGRQAEVRYLDSLTSNVILRSAQTRQEVGQVLAEAEGHEDQISSLGACSSQALSFLREIVASKPMLKGLGIMRDGAIQCATMADMTHPLPLGVAARGLPSGVQSWSGVVLPALPETPFNINARGNYAVFILPMSVLDIALSTDVSITHLSYPSQSIVRSNGFFSPSWAKRYTGADMTFVEGRYLILARNTGKHGDVIFAAMPVTWIQTILKSPTRLIIPLALLIGFLLAVPTWMFLCKRFSLSTEIKTALKNDEFYLLYQPVIDLRNGSCVGAEALIRWKRRDGKQIGPHEFIPVAESNGLIVDVTARVIDLVARDAELLIKMHPDTHIAINVSAEDLQSPDTANKLSAMIGKMNALPHNIVIEATERGLMSPDKATEILLSVRAQGFKVAIDDFGTGNSSLSYLATYKLDFLKIDKMFVDALGKDTPSTKVTMHIIEMARSLKLQMIAEGVETLEQRDILREAGVQFAQGWVFGKPMPMASLSEFILKNPGNAEVGVA